MKNITTLLAAVIAASIATGCSVEDPDLSGKIFEDEVDQRNIEELVIASSVAIEELGDDPCSMAYGDLQSWTDEQFGAMVCVTYVCTSGESVGVCTALDSFPASDQMQS